jgi:flagellar hook protein FlgE
MAISNSLGTGASGVNLFQNALSVTSNNIANTDTIGFKENNVSFSEMISKGSQGMRGGDFQVGQGSIVHSVRNLFTQGDFEQTADPFDLALDGEGFFVLKDPSGSETPLFTRAGDFKLQDNRFLANPDGFLVMGTKLNVNPVTGVATPGEVGPIDLSKRLSLPQLTAKASFVVNLSSQDPEPTATVAGVIPSELESLADPTILAETLTINGVPLGEIVNEAGTIEEQILSMIDAINAVTDITGVEASAATAAGTSIKLESVNGGFVDITMDLETDPDLAKKTGLQQGLFVANGSSAISGRVSTNADLPTVTGTGTRFTREVTPGDAIFINNQKYTVQSVRSDTELTLTTNVSDTGADVDDVTAVVQQAGFSTPITFYDSLGTERFVNLRFRKTSSHEWEWNAVVDEKDNLNGAFDEVQATGKLGFTSTGQLDTTKSSKEPVFTTGGFDFKGIIRSEKDPPPDVDPALDPPDGPPTPDQKVMFDFTGTTQYAARSLSVKQDQDGYATGFLSSNSYSVTSEGIVKGLFSNGKIESLYQLTVATFPNQEGLTRLGGNLYIQSDLSGEQIQGVAGVGGLGSIKSKNREVSTVDLAVQFVKLISFQRGFQANSRVITTSDEVVQELVNLKR